MHIRTQDPVFEKTLFFTVAVISIGHGIYSFNRSVAVSDLGVVKFMPPDTCPGRAEHTLFLRDSLCRLFNIKSNSILIHIVV